MKSLSGAASKTDIASGITARKEAGALWDDWLNVRCQDSLQQFQLAKGEHGVPKGVFPDLQARLSADNAAIVARNLDQSVDAAIKSPGTKSQRLIATLTTAAKIVLPLLALVWIAWRVVDGFVTGAEDRSAYVGLDFLVNGLSVSYTHLTLPTNREV